MKAGMTDDRIEIIYDEKRGARARDARACRTTISSSFSPTTCRRCSSRSAELSAEQPALTD